MLAMKTTGRNSLIGQGGTTAEELVRYALTLPVASAVIGMPNLEIVKSNIAIARALKPMNRRTAGSRQPAVHHGGARLGVAVSGGRLS